MTSVNLRKPHAWLRLANVVSPLYSTRCQSSTAPVLHRMRVREYECRLHRWRVRESVLASCIESLLHCVSIASNSSASARGSGSIESVIALSRSSVKCGCESLFRRKTDSMRVTNASHECVSRTRVTLPFAPTSVFDGRLTECESRMRVTTARHSSIRSNVPHTWRRCALRRVMRIVASLSAYCQRDRR